MKSKLLKTISRLLGVLMAVVSVTLYTACSDTETTDSTKFIIFYTGMTDIGPSMTGEIASPTYKGSAPYDFSITNVTLNEEVYSEEIFSIEPTNGRITLVSASTTPIGKYKVSIACYSNGARYEFEDIVEVNMLKPVPKEVKVVPELIETDYENIIKEDDEVVLPSAQVTTDGNHVSISNYEIAYALLNGSQVSDPTKLFNISNTGEITIVKGNADITPGIYTLALKLTTAASNENDENCIFENALRINITSKPLGITYNPATDIIEAETEDNGGTTFKSSSPVLLGSLEDVVYSISKIEPSTDKITIDATTGIISVATGHKFAVGTQYQIYVKVANKFAPEGIDFLNEPALTLEVVNYISEVANFSYQPKNDAVQGVAFSVEKDANFVGDRVRFAFVNLPTELEGQLDIDEFTGTISAAKGHAIPAKTYNIQVSATNSKNEDNPSIATLTLKVNENPNYFTYIRYGNNLEIDPIANANQFRVHNSTELSSLNLMPSTDIKEGVNVKWEIEVKYQAAGTEIDPNTGKISAKGWKAANCGMVVVTATAGEGPTAVTVKTPVFFHYSSFVREPKDPNPSVSGIPETGISVEYTPFVLQANPRRQTRSAIPAINGITDLSKFVLDYRRTFHYYNLNGYRSDGSEHEDGQVNPSSGDRNRFLANLWDKCNCSYSSKTAVSFFTSSNVAKTDFSTTLAYVDNTTGGSNKFSVVVSPNQWNDDGWANGCFIAQMTFINNGNTAKQLNDGAQVFPFIIWFDTKF